MDEIKSNPNVQDEDASIESDELPDSPGPEALKLGAGVSVEPETLTSIAKEIVTVLETIFFKQHQPKCLNYIYFCNYPDPVFKLGVYGSSDVRRGRLVEKITRMVKSDNVVDVVVKASVTKEPDLRRIQEEIGNMLGLQLHEKTLERRARLLCDRIKTVEKILIILDDLWAEIDLGGIGIPLGNDHTGCKILLLSESRKVVSNQMNTQLQFSVEEGGSWIRSRFISCGFSANGPEVSDSLTSTLDEIMMALKQPDINMLGVCGSSDVRKGRVVETITSRVDRDGLFDVVVKASVMKKPDLKRIQGELGNKLSLQLHEKTLEESARLLCDKIKTLEKILIILDDIWHKINLDTIGIPFGNDHKGCKVLLLSNSREVLYYQMNTQLQFSVEEGEWSQPQSQPLRQGFRRLYNRIMAAIFCNNDHE